jgi:hypothetical protein
MNATPDIETNSLRISEHACIRAATRLGAVKAREHIRSLLDRAEPVDVPYVKDAKAYQAGAVTIVVDPDGEGGGVVETVLRREVEG